MFLPDRLRYQIQCCFQPKISRLLQNFLKVKKINIFGKGELSAFVYLVIQTDASMKNFEILCV